ncbi:HTH-type transcriptional regulator LutR [Roseobacter fucihabitans]|uniref:HTH-type transcriptional regulator LutR n=1 Tax=Roseobacter fucihabitans TaxID=1537242 RepID=A0ABZ2BYL8_9RHOB|nr:GntR family transcriptional regulator [Roseobacter litoralis]MBC6964505.1 HTH-type transcriptional regulator LutR [Roseobacter litoralis]
MTNPTPKSQSNAQRALHALREMIFSGRLAAGSNHLEQELAQLLEMSRTPVREAVLTLEAQGLLELRPRKGVRILPVSPDDMREIYDVLTELESLAAEQAAQKGYGARDLADLARAIEDMEIAVAADNLEQWSEADDRFHGELVRLGQNRRIEAIVMMMRDQVRRARATTLFMRPVPLKSNEAHRRVYQAIEQGDAAIARAAHRAHRQQAREMLVKLLERHRLHAL